MGGGKNGKRKVVGQSANCVVSASGKRNRIIGDCLR